ncbi:MAG: hypothetical protein EP344_16500 [Bacteroidetes bacterium]|nr:MAG: hypothetical protein EP344_16500 [Bacteroidota bacterium]
MGKMKWYATTEDNNIQPGIRKQQSTHFHRQRRQTALGQVFQEQPESPPVDQLFRQILIRLRRSWIALRFQVHRYTLGLFRQHALLKMATLVSVGYLLLASDRQTGLFTESSIGQTITMVPVSNALEAEEPIKGKSLNWSFKSEAPITQPVPPPELPKLGNKPVNEAAPLRADQLRDRQSELYIDRFAKTAIQEMKKYGIPASISLAQGLVESRYGTSKLAVQNNNHFGMKCFSKQCRKGHCSNFSDDHHKDFFRKFKTPWESWRAHSQMLAGGRYSRLKKHGKNYRKWAQGLQDLGYATDRRYAQKLIGVIQKYQLNRYDNQ